MGKALVGIQLYTLREFVAKDFAGTLRRVKMLGYDGVEFAGYCGYTATEIKKMCSDAGLEMIGAHFGLENFENDLEGSVSYHAELG